MDKIKYGFRSASEMAVLSKKGKELQLENAYFIFQKSITKILKRMEQKAHSGERSLTFNFFSSRWSNDAVCKKVGNLLITALKFNGYKATFKNMACFKCHGN